MRKVSEKRLNEIAISNQIELIFCPYILLNTFILPDVISSIQKFAIKQADDKTKRDFFQGYKLAANSVLLLYLDEVVRNPDFIGIPPDLNFQDYWSYTKTTGRDILKSALRRNHAMSAIFARVQSLITEVLRAESWEELLNFSGHIQDFTSCLRKIFTKSYNCLEKINKRWRVVDCEEALRSRAYDVLWTWIMDFKKLRSTYCDVYRDYRPMNREVDRDFEDFYSQETTRFHHKSFENFSSASPPKQWASGCALIILESLCRLSPTSIRPELENLQGQINKIKDWRRFDHFSSNIRDILSQVPDFFNPASRWTFQQKRPVAVSDRRGLMLPVRSISNVEQVKGMLGNRPRIVEVESPAAQFNFRCLLEGAVERAKRTGEKALVAEVKHPAGRGKYDYSFAVFMPAYGIGIIPQNASTWWIFYDICNDFSSSASRMLIEVKKSIEDHSEYIELITMQVDKSEFLNFCEDPGYKYLKEEINDLKRLDSEIRATLPELLLMAYLAAQKYHTVTCHLKPKFLGKELDVVGVKCIEQQPPEVVIFESKGKATRLEDLQKEVDDFADKCVIVEKNVEKLLNTLGIPYQADIKLKCILVSMSELEKNEIKKPASIDLWDFNRLKRELTKARIPKDYINLLKQRILYRSFFLNDSFFNTFFGDQ